jgi:hypothetical protein
MSETLTLLPTRSNVCLLPLVPDERNAHPLVKVDGESDQGSSVCVVLEKVWSMSVCRALSKCFFRKRVECSAMDWQIANLAAADPCEGQSEQDTHVHADGANYRVVHHPCQQGSDCKGWVNCHYEQIRYLSLSTDLYSDTVQAITHLSHLLQLMSTQLAFRDLDFLLSTASTSHPAIAPSDWLTLRNSEAIVMACSSHPSFLWFATGSADSTFTQVSSRWLDKVIARQACCCSPCLCIHMEAYWTKIDTGWMSNRDEGGCV